MTEPMAEGDAVLEGREIGSVFRAQCVAHCSECTRLINEGDKTIKWRNAPYWNRWAHAHHFDPNDIEAIEHGF